ncbi:MAG: (2Fe-2S)-binding protein, partial [Proteobacteria bacterium]|nr:(2Fe-2S)-binding protein [Pseudomonadota bacterium]
MARGGANRIAGGSLVDYGKPLGFEFEGRPYEGLAGDSIASALAANGVWLLSRSFKYHRPRGVLTMAGHDGNTLVQVGNEPNVRADRHAISEGLAVKGQNYRGSLMNDRDAWLGRVSRFLPVGFYYRTFYKPKWAWPRLWEPWFRKSAGLGEADLAAPHGYFDKAFGHYDVAVIGGGPAGMSAAAFAAKAGADVVLINESPVLGGALNYARFDVDRAGAGKARAELVADLEKYPNLTVMTDAACTGWFADNWLSVVRGERLHKIRAREVILAAGAIGQPAQFRNNDLPGIMLGSAAQRLIRLYGVRPGRTAVVVTANDDGYGAALDLLDAGVAVAALVDSRADPGTALCEAA